MSTRLELQTKLETILGSRNVYFQPPENLKIRYPAIIYNLDDVSKVHADDDAYQLRKLYNVILITEDPDNTLMYDILKLKHCRMSRFYVVDNLNHYIFELYF